MGALIDVVEQHITHPDVMDMILFPRRYGKRMTPEEIVDEGLKHEPPALPPSSILEPGTEVPRNEPA